MSCRFSSLPCSRQNDIPSSTSSIQSQYAQSRIIYTSLLIPCIHKIINVYVRRKQYHENRQEKTQFNAYFSYSFSIRFPLFLIQAFSKNTTIILACFYPFLGTDVFLKLIKGLEIERFHFINILHSLQYDIRRVSTMSI